MPTEVTSTTDTAGSGVAPKTGAATLSIAAMASTISEALRTNDGCTVTWLNHVSAPVALATPHLWEMTLVGIDGKLLQKLIGAVERTSADLVLPAVFQSHTSPLRVGFIGSSPERTESIARALSKQLPPGSTVALACDGYSGLARGIHLAESLRAARLDLLILGLGAGLQEEVAVEAASLDPNITVVTCGGWLDQILIKRYYPRWAYPLRLNWLVRLCREPRRLWRRYTLDAVRAAAGAKNVRAACRTVPGLFGSSGHRMDEQGSQDPFRPAA